MLVLHNIKAELYCAMEMVVHYNIDHHSFHHSNLPPRTYASLPQLTTSTVSYISTLDTTYKQCTMPSSSIPTPFSITCI